jgi:hypothetical protein
MRQFRYWIAGIIAPELVRRSDELSRVLSSVEDAEQWMAHEFPDVGAVCDHLLMMHAVRTGAPWPPRRQWSAPNAAVHEISSFREWMRRRTKTGGE